MHDDNAAADKRPRRKRAFLHALADTVNVAAACRDAGVPRRTVYDWRDADPDFARRWNDALDDGIDLLEAMLHRRAFEGVEKPVWHKGEQVGTTRHYSDALAMFLLKAHRPERYRDNYRPPAPAPVAVAADVFPAAARRFRGEAEREPLAAPAMETVTVTDAAAGAATATVAAMAHVPAAAAMVTATVAGAAGTAAAADRRARHCGRPGPGVVSRSMNLAASAVSRIGAPSPAVYACDPAASRGRLHAEPESPTRTPFQRDRDRILHSTAFRRLKHKTQVFVYHEGDHYRTRLTHSLEVAQVARTIARTLGLNEDLAETLALAHDLGHPPFGHAGEEALDEAMAPYGGFDHNVQTLRVVTGLERRYAAFDGLNLTWETLEGVVKHNGPLTGPRAAGSGGGPLHEALAEYVGTHDLELSTFAGAEAQVAAISDDIAYNNHDVDDGLRANLFDFADLRDVPLVGQALAEVRDLYPGLERSRAVHETIRRLISLMIEDVVAESRSRLARAAPRSADAVRRSGREMIGMSADVARGDRGLKAFLFANMYRHARVGETSDRGRRVVAEIFGRYLKEPESLPGDWRESARRSEADELPRLACDFIAGMTDRYALSEHRRLFSSE